MLKGKKGIYILIPLNILIWSFFVYRFFSIYNEGNEVQISQKINLEKEELNKDSTTYKLLLNYSDPFLKQNEFLNRKNNRNSPVQFIKSEVKVFKADKKKEMQKLMPEIKYLGLVKNSSTGYLTAIVSINGNSKLIKQNEVIDGIEFNSISSNNLVIHWNKEKIIINK